MEQPQARASTPRPVIFRDGLGRRCRMLDTKGMEKLEVLCFHQELATTESFEPALRERLGRLTSFRHAAFAKVRTVQHMRDAAATLVLVSECTPGVRLAELLGTAHRHGVAIDSGAAWSIIRQLVSAVAALHEHAPDVGHGAIAPERIVVTPDARLVLVEHVLGSALELLRFSQERYWKELRIASPRASGPPPLDLRADVTQLGVVALSVILGRPLGDDEYPLHVAEMVESASITSVHGELEPMPLGLRSWLDRTLQLDERRSFSSAIEASVELDRVLEESESVLVPLALEAFLTRFHKELDQRKRPRTALAAPPAEHSSPSPQPMPAVDSAPSSLDTSSANPRVPVTGGIEVERRRASAGPDVTLTLRDENNTLDPEPAVAHASSPAVQPAKTTNPALLQFGLSATNRTPSRPAWTRPAWSQRARSRQVVVATLLTVLGGAGWMFASRVSEVRAEPTTTVATPTPTAAEVTAPDVATASAAMAPGLSSDVQPTALMNDPSAARPAATPPPAAATPPPPVAIPPSPAPSGWVTVSAPGDLQVYTNGLLLGTSQGGRIALTTGTHQLELVNDAIGYRSTRTVQVRKAETASINVEFPNGTLALNATPWAEVSIDGRNVGETPIGNLPIRVGSHEVVFRHPELGEQRVTATVTLTAPTRLSVDMRKR